MEELVRDDGGAGGASVHQALKAVHRGHREDTERHRVPKQTREAVDVVLKSSAAARVRICVSKVDRATVLLAGDRQSLMFLSKLIAAQADTADESNGLQIGPKCAGSRLFAPSSTLGLYIHRITTDSPLHKSGRRKSADNVANSAKVAPARKRTRSSP